MQAPYYQLPLRRLEACAITALTAQIPGAEPVHGMVELTAHFHLSRILEAPLSSAIMDLEVPQTLAQVETTDLALIHQ